VAGTAAPDEAVACTAIGVSEPTAVGVIAGNERAVTLIGGGAGGRGGRDRGRALDDGRRGSGSRAQGCLDAILRAAPAAA
jgi:hypothetical protein